MKPTGETDDSGNPVLKRTDIDEPALEFQLKWLEEMWKKKEKAQADDRDIYFDAARSFGDEMMAVVMFDLMLFVIAMVVMCVFFTIMIYCVIQCFLKGFSLSLISFSKWVISTIITIILVPKFQPTVSEYIESEFINNVGLGIVIFAFTLFITILIGKSLNKVVTWTGVGSIDKTFGLLFGFFKGYVVAVCLFSILNWFYPYKNWGINIKDSISFDLISAGSKILIEEFPTGEDLIDTKDKIEKI